MKKQMYQQCAQLSFNFEFQAVSIEKEIKNESKSSTVAYHITKAEFEESMAIENDLLNGRGAWLYQQLQKELAFQRKQAQMMAQFEAMRAEAYKYNF